MERIQKEEEENSLHLEEGFEYKILRFASGSRGAIQKKLKEEEYYGWSLFETLDSHRYRLRRKFSERLKDSERHGDPYVTDITGTPFKVICSSIALIIFLFFLLACS
ncbi:MAG: hypothetical protein CMO81_00135 [Waddliaceae bacterium]|nr:hypothetical protein [Waddliaceae bacterium]